MTATLLGDLLAVALIATGGFAGGWWARWYKARRRTRASDDDRRVVQDVLAKVHALVGHVSEEMGQHGDYLAEINEGLTVAVTEESKLAATSLAKLLVANSRMRERLAVAEARLQEQSHTIAARAAEARTDSVTRLVNRQAFDDEIKRCFAAYRRQGRRFSVVLLDVDHFGRWIDRHGRLLGDEMLGRVAEVLRDNAREMDLVARRGDDQFAVLLPGTSLADAVTVASRMCGAVASVAFACGDEQAAATLSAGAAEAGPEDSATTLIARTRSALETSKSAGRNSVHYHDGAAVRPAAEPTAATPAVDAAAGGNRTFVDGNDDPLLRESEPETVDSRA